MQKAFDPLLSFECYSSRLKKRNTYIHLRNQLRYKTDKYVRDEMERFFLVEINLNTILVCLYNLDFQFEGFGYRLEIMLKKGKKKVWTSLKHLWFGQLNPKSHSCLHSWGLPGAMDGC